MGFQRWHRKRPSEIIFSWRRIWELISLEMWREKWKDVQMSCYTGQLRSILYCCGHMVPMCCIPIQAQMWPSTRPTISFRETYICFEPCKTGFISGCRKVIGVDGCYLRGCFGGILLTSIGLYANDCIYPIVYAVVQKENTPSWMWFMRLLAADLEISGDGWTLITGR